VPDLIPAFAEDTLVPLAEDTTPGYGQSFLFDFDQGEFVGDGRGGILKAGAETAWATWCVKAVLTERGAFAAYDPDFGLDLSRVRLADTRAEREAELQRAITEAIEFDPRTASVENFTFVWEGDEVRADFTCVPVIGTTKRVDVRLTGF
jgi:hypothetical protein